MRSQCAHGAYTFWSEPGRARGSPIEHEIRIPGFDVTARTTDDSLYDDGPASSSASVRVLIEETGRPPRVFEIVPGREAKIGRGLLADISLDDARVSRDHAVLSFDGAGVRVRDLGSSNGTFLGDRRLTTPAPLTPGDVVRVGSTRIAIVQWAPGSPSPETHGPVVGPVASGTDIIAVDPASVALFALARRLAGSDLPVLVTGDTGSGKEVVARILHRHSARAGRPFLAINCATLPDSLADSELFGHEKGSFTGAIARKIGAFEAATGGTLLLDEVGELSASNQARLLRVLQERVVLRVGGVQPIAVDVRIVAATNRDVVADVARGRFREDLYFRLNGVTISVPNLRSRPRDILPLAERFIAEHGAALRLGTGVGAILQSYRWPGNVRELRNAIECALALLDGDEIQIEHLPPAVRGDLPTADAGNDAQSPLRSRLDNMELRSLIEALDQHSGNQSRAARALGISRRALIYKMERFGLKPRPSGDRTR